MGRGQDVSATPFLSHVGLFVEGVQGEGLGCVFFEVGSFFSARPEPNPVKYKTPLAFVQYFF